MDAPIDRRTLLAGAGALATLSALPGAAAAAHHEHKEHHAAGTTKLDKALAHCLASGERCIAHCLESFAAGDTSLAACAKSVREMMALCHAMQTIVAMNSSYEKSLGELCERVCRECEKVCRKHARMHATCRDCAEACVVVADLIAAR